MLAGLTDERVQCTTLFVSEWAPYIAIHKYVDNTLQQLVGDATVRQNGALSAWYSAQENSCVISADKSSCTRLVCCKQKIRKLFTALYCCSKSSDCPSFCPSVRLSVCNVEVPWSYISWVTWKITIEIISLRSSEPQHQSSLGEHTVFQWNIRVMSLFSAENLQYLWNEAR